MDQYYESTIGIWSIRKYFWSSGKFSWRENLGDFINENNVLIDIIPTGLLIKYYPTIGIIYFGFGLLMLTACLSAPPYPNLLPTKLFLDR
jgi:hypothetical protein